MSTGGAPRTRRLGTPRWTAALRGLEPYIADNRRFIVAVALTSMVLGFAEAALLFVIVRVATALTAGEDTVALSAGPFNDQAVSLDALLLGAGALLIALMLLAVANSASVATMTSRTLRNARTRTFSSFVHASWAVQSAEGEGQLQETLTTHVQRVSQGSLQLSMAIGAMASFLAYLVSALLVDPVAATAVLAGVIIVGLVLLPLTRVTRRLSSRNLAMSKRYSQEVAQTFRLAREIHVFDAADAVAKTVNGTAVEAERMQFKSRFIARLTPSVYQYLALGLVILGLAALSATSADNVADLGAVVLLLVRALSYGQQLSTNAQQLADSASFIDSIQDAQRRYEGARVHPGGRELGPIRELALVNAQYGYKHDHLVLRNVDLKLTAGAALGVVGPSGAGKSTLVQVLLRLREPTDGAYLVNGAPASSYSLRSWTREVAFVPQDNQLLSASVADNIRFLRPDIADDDVELAAKGAHIFDEIVRLPRGFETLIGPGHRDLSGGQRQRLGIARALAGRPSLVVLDEPTSALDPRSEELIRETLHDLKGRVILVVVAHRITTLSMCDWLVRVEAGRVSLEPSVATAEAERA